MTGLVQLKETLELVRPRVVALTTPAGRETALKALALVVGSYRTSYADDRVFSRQAAAALEDFPELVLEELASPKIGIIRELKFSPSVAELVDWCERRQGEKIAAAATTPEQKAAIFHAAERGEPWAVRYYRMKGVAI
ncbi:MAG: hypothetical protein ACK4MV_09600 [Beijerinckiaceae bacterium]